MNALRQAWARTVRRRGEARAIVEAATGNACSFRALEARARGWAAAHANQLADARGRAVVFALPNGIAWFEVFLGLQHAGAVPVPLDGAEPVAAQRRMAGALRAAFWWDAGRLQPLARPRRFRDPETCVIKLTSGSTGTPRALAFTARQMLADARQVTSTMGIRATDLNYALIPLGHSYGLGNLTLPLIAHGVPLVAGSAPLPHAMADDFVRWRPTVFPTVPAVLRGLLAADVPRDALASVRTVISAGAPLAPEVAREFATRFGRRVHSFYGSSETGGIAYDRTGAATLAGGVGRALRGVSIKAVQGQRIQVSSPAVFTPGNVRAAGNEGAWIPPDRAMLDRKGGLTLFGRRGTTVKIGGRRVNLGEVVARLRRLRGVREVWVGVSGGVEPMLGAAVATNRTVTDLRRELLEDTAPWKIPKQWAILAELPLTARGKVDTRAAQAAVFGVPRVPTSAH